MIRALYRDVPYAARQLLKYPGFTLPAVLILALGIGANSAVFSLFKGVVLNPLPYDDMERLVILRQQMPGAGIEELLFSPPEVADYRGQSQSFESIVEYHSMWFTLLGGETPQRVQTAVVSAEYFHVLGVEPVHGRSFLAGDEAMGAEPVLLLGNDFWKRSFGGDPGIVGRTFEMNDKIHTVVGVLPPFPQYQPERNDVFMPISACPFRAAENTATNRNAHILHTLGKLKPGVTREQAQADVSLVAGRLVEEHSEVYSAEQGYSTTLSGLREELIGEASSTLWVLLGTVGMVLLITCANLANLLLARHMRRERELAIRTALGANRGSLIRMLLTESTVLAMVGGAFGLLAAFLVLDLLTLFASRYTTRTEEVAIDVSVVVFTLGLSLLTGLSVGAISVFRSGGGSLANELREGGGRAGTGRGARHLRNGLIVVELATSFVLLVGAGLMIRTMTRLYAVDPGFRSQDVLTMVLSLNWSTYDDAEKRRDFFARLLDKIETLPGVESSGLAGTYPLNEGVATNGSFLIKGQPLVEGRASPRADFRVASSGYFETLGIPLLQGRFFTEADHEEAAKVAVVSQSLARRYWDGENPLGKEISSNRGEDWWTVVGVVGDLHHYGVDSEVAEEIYRPFRQRPMLQMSLVLRSSAGDPAALLPQIREAVHAIDPEQPIAKVRALDEVLRGSLAAPRLTSILLSLFAGLALVVSMAGLAGVIGIAVSQRTREIGIRMTLGALRRDVVWAVLRGALMLMLLGLVLGAAGAFYLSRLMSGLLFEVAPTDPAAFAAAALVLMVVGGLACLLPAGRATRVSPVVALRYD